MGIKNYRLVQSRRARFSGRLKSTIDPFDRRWMRQPIVQRCEPHLNGQDRSRSGVRDALTMKARTVDNGGRVPSGKFKQAHGASEQKADRPAFFSNGIRDGTCAGKVRQFQDAEYCTGSAGSKRRTPG